MRSEKLEKRNKIVSIDYEETGEQFNVPLKVAIPIILALRVYRDVESIPECTDYDLYATAQILSILSGIQV